MEWVWPKVQSRGAKPFTVSSIIHKLERMLEFSELVSFIFLQWAAVGSFQEAFFTASLINHQRFRGDIGARCDIIGLQEMHVVRTRHVCVAWLLQTLTGKTLHLFSVTFKDEERSLSVNF